MKNFFLNLIITASVICSSCSTVAYLPDTKRIVDNQYGSYIKIRLSTNISLEGELIAVTPKILYVLTNDKNVMRLDSVSLTQVKNYSLRYAKSNATNYAWTIPLGAAVSITHGWYAVFSLPVNLITTTAITLSAGNSFVLSKNDILWDELSKFARFPQGIPPNILLKDIQ